MQNLPAEILRSILAYLTAEDTHATSCALANLRLTSRSLAELVAPYHFKTVPLWFSVTSLENLSALSSNEKMYCDLARADNMAPLTRPVRDTLRTLNSLPYRLRLQTPLRRKRLSASSNAKVIRSMNAISRLSGIVRHVHLTLLARMNC